MTALGFRSITDTARLIQARALSPVDLVRECLTRIDARRETNAFITVMREQALDEAARARARIDSGEYLGPLHGIPVAIKDLVHVAGTPTTAGSMVPAHRAAADAPVVAHLRAAGAIVIGKTNLHEFAFGTTSDETAFGPVRNPHDLGRSAGGSSGGSAAALVDGMCLGAVGTDTGGSIRIPAAACGIVGLKPGFDELSCEGVVPLCETLDHVGPMARTVADAALLFQGMRGVPVRSLTAADARLTLGVPRPYFFERVEGDTREAVEDALQRIEAGGGTLRDVTIENAGWTPDVYLHICLPEASRYHAPNLARHAGKYSPGVRLRLEMGGYLLAEDYVRAMRLREVLRRAVDRALAGCDALALPALPIPAPPVGAASVEIDGTAAPVRAAMLSRTQLFNLTGHPAIALPAGRGRDGLPRGLQLVGHRGRTERLLEIALLVERLLPPSPALVS